MHFDLAHAAGSAIVIIATIYGLRYFGVIKEKKGWNWTLFFAVFIVMAIFNLIWPYPS